MFRICCSESILCLVVYLPPYPSADFLPQFSDLLSFIVLNYDKAIIVVDFDTHIDYSSKHFATEFLNISLYESY